MNNKQIILDNISECLKLFPELTFSQILFHLDINQVDHMTIFKNKPMFIDNYNDPDKIIAKRSIEALKELKNKI